ncbi:MAG: radical SAM protein [Patescibacteria group bacterium]
MSKIIFVNPKYNERLDRPEPPIDLLCVAGYLKQNNHHVDLFDFNINKNNLKDFSFVGYNFAFLALPTLSRFAAFKLAKIIKQNNPQIIIVAGTISHNESHSTTMWKQVLDNYNCIDICIIGEAEDAMLELANGKNMDDIKDIAFRKDGKAIKTLPRELEKNLDKFGAPAWELIDFKQYGSAMSGFHNDIDLSKETTVPLKFSRGCPGSCKFCALWWMWKKWRTRSGAHMAEEVINLYKNYGLRSFEFRDDCFGVNKNALNEFCDAVIKSNIKVAFSLQSRVDVLNNKEELVKLKEAGCHSISYGVETGSQKILDEFHKEVNVDGMKATLRLAREVGFKIHALMITGSPFETPETVNETIDFLNEVNPDTSGTVGGIILVPGTAYYNKAKNAKYIDDSYWLKDNDFPIDYSTISRFKVFVFNKAVRNRKKITDIKKEYNFINIAQFSITQLLHILGLRNFGQKIAGLLRKSGFNY